MSDENTLIDIDSLSDEDFMKLDPKQIQELIPVDEPATPEEDSDLEENTDNDDELDGQDDLDEGNPSGSETSDPDLKPNDKPVDPSADIKDKSVKDADPKGKTPEAPKGKDEKPAEPNPAAKPETKDQPNPTGIVKTDPKAAVDFFKKVSAPFKADGREMQVRSPEDVIRLMQMGVNYSRHMQEMKPLRAQDQMLKSNGLNDPEKLNFLIDLSKGNKNAIKKLLQDHKIDPVDIDTTADDKPYQANNYAGDPKDLTFDDAIKETMAAEGGRELISDINRDWDVVSKEALRDQPAIFQNILAQKRSGVYLKIQEELKYQRTMGFLTDVPFLQAYHQVGEAMQKAGVFGSTTTEDQPTTRKVVGAGTRKAALKPNTEQPTPNVSSASPPRSAPANAGWQKAEPDYSAMSDEEFKKLAPPT
jgi:hypothetical protein